MKTELYVAAVTRAYRRAIDDLLEDPARYAANLDSYMDEKILEKSGISWAKRKALKAVMGTFPSQKEKFNYTVKGNVVTCGSGKDKEVFTLSKDGKYLYGKTEDGYKFTLTRTK